MSDSNMYNVHVGCGTSILGCSVFSKQRVSKMAEYVFFFGSIAAMYILPLLEQKSTSVALDPTADPLQSKCSH